jgi:hypothetical protein
MSRALSDETPVNGPALYDFLRCLNYSDLPERAR